MNEDMKKRVKKNELQLSFQRILSGRGGKCSSFSLVCPCFKEKPHMHTEKKQTPRRALNPQPLCCEVGH